MTDHGPLRILIDVGDEQPTPTGVDLHVVVGDERGQRDVRIVHQAEDTPSPKWLRQIYTALLYSN